MLQTLADICWWKVSFSCSGILDEAGVHAYCIPYLLDRCRCHILPSFDSRFEQLTLRPGSYVSELSTLMVSFVNVLAACSCAHVCTPPVLQ